MSSLAPPTVDPDVQPPTASDTFRARYHDALERYALSLSSPIADLVVAGPRKAPRLLELVHGSEELPDLPLPLTVSERALTFSSPEQLAGRVIVLTDDTIVYGSTFFGALSSLREVGAEVIPRVLGISRGASAMVAQEFDEVPLRLTESEVHTMIDLEIRAFGSLAVPYDVDHPIVSIPLDDEHEVVVERFRMAEPGAWESTRSWQSEHGVRVFTLALPERVQAEHSQRYRQLGPCKLRLFFDARRRTARVVGIFCLGLRERELLDPALFAAAPAPLADCWRTALTQVERAGWPQAAQHRAMASTAHYLASLEATARWLHDESATLSPATGPAGLRAFDLRLLFGIHLGDALHRSLETLLDADAELSPAHPAHRAHVRLDAEAEADAVLAGPFGEQFGASIEQYLQFTFAADTADRSHALFNAQRRIYDDLTRGGAAPDPTRLSRSLVAYAAVPVLLSRYGAQLGRAEFDHWCDLAIDGGSIVPHYHPAASQSDLWVRCVRAGERREEKLKYWLHGAVTAAQRYLRARGDDDAELSWYVAEKALATTVACLGAELRGELACTVQNGWDEFGARAELSDLKDA